MTGRRRVRMPAAAVAAALLLSLSACATPQLFVANRAPAPIFEGADVCDADAATGGVPDRFDAVAAYLCDPVLTMVPIDPDHTPPPLDFDSGGGTVPREEILPAPSDPEPSPRRFEGDLAPLLAALSVPDQAPTDGVCSLAMVVPPDVRLIDEHGRWVRPAIPRTGCGQAVRAAVDEALTRLAPVD